MSEPTPVQNAVQAQKVAAITIAEYDRMAAAYRRGTADHDVSPVWRKSSVNHAQ